MTAAGNANILAAVSPERDIPLIEKWDPAAQPPDSATNGEKVRWLINHMIAFQRAHPEVPQNDYYAMRESDQKKLVRAYNQARGEAMKVKN